MFVLYFVLHIHKPEFLENKPRACLRERAFLNFHIFSENTPGRLFGGAYFRENPLTLQLGAAYSAKNSLSSEPQIGVKKDTIGAECAKLLKNQNWPLTDSW